MASPQFPLREKMNSSVVLEWRNLNLTIEKREFSYLKWQTNVEEKRILENGMKVTQIDEL